MSFHFIEVYFITFFKTNDRNQKMSSTDEYSSAPDLLDQCEQHIEAGLQGLEHNAEALNDAMKGGLHGVVLRSGVTFDVYNFFYPDGKLENLERHVKYQIDDVCYWRNLKNEIETRTDEYSAPSSPSSLSHTLPPRTKTKKKNQRERG